MAYKIGQTVTASSAYQTHQKSGGGGQTYDMGAGASGTIKDIRTVGGQTWLDVDYSASGGGTGWSLANPFAAPAAKPAGGAPAPINTQPTVQPQATPEISQFKDFLNAEQTKLKDARAKQTGMFKTDEQIKADVFASMPQIETPDVPSLVDIFNTMRSDADIQTLEGKVNDLTFREDEILATMRQRQNAVRQKDVMSHVAAGQIGEIERQERETLEFIGRVKERAINELNTRYKMIDMVMNYTQMDFNNAMQVYNAEYTKAMAVFNAIREDTRWRDTQLIEETRRTEDRIEKFQLKIAEWEREDRENLKAAARANLTTLANLVTAGNISYENMSASQRLEVEKMEISAGLGAGFLQKLKTNREVEGAKVLTHNTREGADGYSYTDIIYQNPDGSLTTKSIKGGAVYREPKTDDKASTILKTYQTAADNLLKSIGNRDTSIDVNEKNKVIDQLINMTKDVGLANQLFEQAMLNNNAWKDERWGKW